MCPDSLDVSDLTLDSSLRSNGLLILLIPCISLLLVLGVLDVKTTSRKSWTESFCGSDFFFYLPFKVKFVLATFNPFALLSLVC